MTRKDIIIISLLINAGILALLFMLAINQDDALSDLQSPDGVALVDNQSIEKGPFVRKERLSVPEQVEETERMHSSLSSEEMDDPFLVDEEGYVQLENQPPKIVKESLPSGAPNLSENLYEYVEVKVKKGDALEKIARNNGTTVEAIKQANQLTSAKLSIGQVLRIPVSAKQRQGVSSIAEAAPLPVAATPVLKAELTPVKGFVQNSEPLYHVVKSGDSPWKIAKQYSINVDDLLKMNDMSEARARNLKIGERIRVH